MKKQWFVYSNEVVSGPFATDDLKNSYEANRWPHDAVVWWKGQKDWLSLEKWHSNLPAILEATKRQGQQPVWYAEQRGQQVGPMTKTDMINHLRKLKTHKDVRLWTIGLDHWTNLFEFHEVVEAIGMTRRTFDRAPIVGQVLVQRGQDMLEKPLSSVSGGGLGLKHSAELNPGEIVTVAIKSPLLINPVRATARVMYVEDGGFAGLQFQSIHIEGKTTLMDYVKQFKTDYSSLTTDDVTRIRKSA